MDRLGKLLGYELKDGGILLLRFEQVDVGLSDLKPLLNLFKTLFSFFSA